MTAPAPPQPTPFVGQLRRAYRYVESERVRVDQMAKAVPAEVLQQWDGETWTDVPLIYSEDLPA